MRIQKSARENGEIEREKLTKKKLVKVVVTVVF